MDPRLRGDDDEGKWQLSPIDSRHPELVSGSTRPPAKRPVLARWMLKQVQHDGMLIRHPQAPPVIPAKAGIHKRERPPFLLSPEYMDPRLRGDDGGEIEPPRRNSSPGGGGGPPKAVEG